MIEPEALADRLQDCAVLLRTKAGPLTWQRCDDWEDAKMPRPVEPLSDEQEQAARAGRSEDDETRRRDEAAAARYNAELKALVRRLEADVNRLSRIIGICNPPQAKRLERRELQAAQVAAEGWCVSCWRGGERQEIELQPSPPDVPSRPYYRDLCRWCGSFKAAHGQLPPASLVNKRHRVGERVTTADVAKALAR